MKIVLVVRDRAQLDDYRVVAKAIEDGLPAAQVEYWCGERSASRHIADPRVTYLFEGLDAFIAQHSGQDHADLSARLQASDLPITLYQSDPRYVYGECGERELVLEKLYLGDVVSGLLEAARPDYLFAGAAGHMFWTVSTLLAERRGVPSYRILGLSYLNPGSKGIRYWFTENLEARLSSDPRDSMSWPQDEVSEFVSRLLDSIRTESYRLDQWARTVRRSAFLSQGWGEIILDLWRWLRHGNRRARWRVRSVLHDMLNTRLATPIDELDEPYIVFPLNMPVDEQLTLRAPHVRDLFSPIEQIANVLPYGHTLVVKEHPVFPGMLDSHRLRRLLKRRPNVKFVANSTSIHSLLDRASMVISVNSTAAVDALVRGVPVVTLGEVFYKGTGLTYDVEYMYELPAAFKEALVDERAGERQAMLASVMCSLFQESYPGAEVVGEEGSEERFRILGRGIVRKVSTHCRQVVASGLDDPGEPGAAAASAHR